MAATATWPSAKPISRTTFLTLPWSDPRYERPPGRCHGRSHRNTTRGGFLMTADSPLAEHGATHVVLNQVPPFEDVNLFATNAALRDAVKFNAPGLATDALSALGAQAGSRAMQQHARLANLHPPTLHSHDRFGNRID